MNNRYDAAIIGGGPAGVTAALYLAKAGMTVCIVMKDDGALKKAEIIDNYYGLPGVSGQELAKNGINQARSSGAEIIKDEVTNIGYDGCYILNTLTDEKISADCVLIATGTSRTMPKIGNLTEGEGKGVSYCAVCDGSIYRGKPVAVIGAGDYAAAEAYELSKLGCDVTVLTNGTEESEKIRQYKTRREKIDSINIGRRVEGVKLNNGDVLPVSAVFVAVGTAGGFDFAKKLQIETAGSRIVVSSNGATVMPGLFAAGDCVNQVRQISAAAAGGCAAAFGMIEYLRTIKKG